MDYTFPQSFTATTCAKNRKVKSTECLRVHKRQGGALAVPVTEGTKQTEIELSELVTEIRERPSATCSLQSRRSKTTQRGQKEFTQRRQNIQTIVVTPTYFVYHG